MKKTIVHWFQNSKNTNSQKKYNLQLCPTSFDQIMPEFSVVISVYNKEAFIATTLKSVLAQTFQDFEIIIRNDGSSDNSGPEILKFKDKRIKYYPGANIGASGARNFLIDKAKGSYIAFLDADDFWYPYYLEEQIRMISQYPEESIFATASAIKRNGKIFENKYSLKTENSQIQIIDYFMGSTLTSLLHSSSTVIRKNVFEKIGYYDTNLKSGEDIDLYIRIGLNYNIVFSSKVCSVYIIRKNSLSQTANKISDKPNFTKYEKFEADNPGLKKFLDLNRYANALSAILEGNKNAFSENYNKIDHNNLSRTQHLLLKQNKTGLQFLRWLQAKLEGFGVKLTSFK